MMPQNVFNYFVENYSLTLLESEYEDIKNVIFSNDENYRLSSAVFNMARAFQDYIALELIRLRSEIK